MLPDYDKYAVYYIYNKIKNTGKFILDFCFDDFLFKLMYVYCCYFEFFNTTYFFTLPIHRISIK